MLGMWMGAASGLAPARLSLPLAALRSSRPSIPGMADDVQRVGPAQEETRDHAAPAVLPAALKPAARVAEGLLLLPSHALPGPAPEIVGGEMELAELDSPISAPGLAVC